MKDLIYRYSEKPRSNEVRLILISLFRSAIIIQISERSIECYVTVYNQQRCKHLFKGKYCLLLSLLLCHKCVCVCVKAEVQYYISSKS